MQVKEGLLEILISDQFIAGAGGGVFSSYFEKGKTKKELKKKKEVPCVEKIRKNIYHIVYSILILSALVGIDVGIFLYEKTGQTEFLTEMGVKIGGVWFGLLFAENIVIICVLVFQNKIREKFFDRSLMQIINVLVFLFTPILTMVLVQRIINAGIYELRGEYFIKNIIIYYIFYIIVLMVFNKVSVSGSLYIILLCLFALIDYFVTVFRGNAFVLMDIFNVSTAAEVAANYSLKLPIRSGVCLLAVLLFLLFQMIFQSLKIGSKNIQNYILRFSVLITMLLCAVGNWNQIAGESLDQWDIDGEYRNRGYLYILACETQYLQIEKPKEYSIEYVNEIKNGVEEKDSERNNNKKFRYVPKNIIVIMNESLADFEEFDNLKASEDILTGIHSLHENTQKGYVYVPSFGGGTADTEYEVLTGNTKQFLPNGGIAYQMYCGKKEYGLANTMEQEDYISLALHPGEATAWKRSDIYTWMNFEQFINLENWNSELEYYRSYVSDLCAYDKIKELYADNKNEKKFIFCVTIQNHGGYDVDKNQDFTSDVKLFYAKNYPDAEIYLSLAKKSDSAFMNLLDYFKKVDEPTMIVMFGDHWPSLDKGFFTELMGQNFETLNLIQKQEIYKTPYIIWTNYPSESIQENMSANYFGSYILEQAGLEMTTYNKFLLQLKEKLPIIGIDAVCDAKGNWYSMDSLPEEYEELLEEYRILQYNNVEDRKNRINSIFELTD